MDELYQLANKITISLDRQNLEIGYDRMNETLYDEIPRFVNLLKQYSNKPEDFLRLLGDIYSHWGAFLSKRLISDIKKYSNLINNLKMIEIEKQRELMELAMQHPSNIKAQEEEMNLLSGSLENMLSSTSDLADLLGNTSIGKKPVSRGPARGGVSKQKRPPKRTKTVLNKLSGLGI